ncbi:MAG: gfo/Idh/MocA family oxidoreductase [Verrucomicrobia bacterium]|nr:gfo/Idh/MocA family oxidoreductase [Verrucomicrobiota bacterium]
MRRRTFLTSSAMALSAAWLRAQSPDRPLTVGVIGHTGQGNYGHGLDVVWLEIPGTKIVAVADADAAGLANEVKKLNGVRAYADYRTMLAETTPDIAAICPRHIHEHHEMLLAAIAAGVKGVYIEKPFVRTLVEADEVVKLCSERGVRLAIAHRNRYHPVLPLVQKLVEAGEIGDLKEVRVSGKQDHRGGGLDLWVLGGHGFNLATLFTGPAISCEAKVLVQGRPATKQDIHPGDEGVGPIVGDEIHARYETKSGIPLYFDSKKDSWVKGASFGARLIGTKGVFSFRIDEEPLVLLEREGERIPVTTAGIGQPEPVADIKRINGGHHGAVLDLLAAIAEKRDPLCGPEAGRETTELAMAVFASFAAGGARVSMPLASRAHPLVFA